MRLQDECVSCIHSDSEMLLFCSLCTAPLNSSLVCYVVKLCVLLEMQRLTDVVTALLPLVQPSCAWHESLCACICTCMSEEGKQSKVVPMRCLVSGLNLNPFCTSNISYSMNKALPSLAILGRSLTILYDKFHQFPPSEQCLERFFQFAPFTCSSCCPMAMANALAHS